MRLRTVLRWSRRIFLVLLIALAAVYLLRDRILARPLANLVAEQLSAALGGRFSLERVEGTYFTNLRLIGLRTLEAPPTGPLTRLDFARAEAKFTLFKLRLDELVVEGLSAEVDLDRPSEPSDEPFDLGTLPAFPSVKVDGTVGIVAGERRFAVGQFEIEGDGKAFTIHTRNVDLAGRFKAEKFGGVLERVAPDTLVWTSEDTIHGVHPRHVRVVLSGDIEARSELGFGGGEIVAGYVGSALHVVAQNVRVDDRIEIVSLEANVDPAAGTATVSNVEAKVDQGHCTIRDAQVQFDHPFFVTRLAQLDIALPDIEPYAGIHAGVTMRASLEKGVLNVAEMAVERGPSRVHLQGRATLPADPKRWRQATIDASLTGTLDALSIPSNPELPSMSGTVAISGHLLGTLAHPKGTLSVEGDNVRIDGKPIRALAGRGTLDYPRLSLESLVFRAEPGHLDLSGTIDLEAATLRDGAYQLDISDLAALGRMIPGSPPLKGALRGAGRIRIGEQRSGRLELSGTDLVIGEVALSRFAVKAQLVDDELTLESLSAASEMGQFELRGNASIDAQQGRLTHLLVEARGRRAELVQPVQIDWSDGAISFRDLDATVLGGTLRGSGRYAENIALDLVASGLRVLDGELDARAALSGTLVDPRFEIAVRSKRLVYRGHDAALDFKLRQEKDGIVLETLHLDGGENLRIEGTAAWPIVVGRNGTRHTERTPRLALTAHAVFEELAAELPRGVGFRRLDLTAEVNGVDAHASCRVQDLAWTSEARVVLTGETSLVVNGNADRMIATLETPEQSPIRTSATLTSKTGIDWSKAHEMVERILESSIEGNAKLHLVDLSPLGKFKASPVADLRGTAEVDVTLGGVVQAPVLAGSATLDCPHVRLKADMPSLQDLKGRIVFDRSEMRIETITARLGYAPLTVTGSVGLREDAALNLLIKGDNILLARTPYLRMRSNVDVAIQGPLDALEIKGAIDITDVLYSEPIKLLSQGGASADSAVQLFHIRRGALSRMKLDLRVRANETIRLDNNVVRGLLSADLHIRGTGAVPQQEGRLDFRDLRFTFPVTRERLKIERGSVVFERGDPFNPLVRARAEARKMGHDLTVDVTGKVSSLEIHITSIPALPRDEAVLLLTTGALRDNLAESGAYSAGMFAGRAILEKFLGESDPDEESFIDRFDVETGRDVSPQGDPTIQARFRISKAERWYAFGERDRWGDYNGGVMLRFRFK